MSNKQTRVKLSLVSITNLIIRHFTLVFSLIFILSFCLSIVLGSCRSQLINQPTSPTEKLPSSLTKVVRIGHHRLGAMFYLKAKGSLETRLAKMGWSVEWTKFVAVPAILEAIGKGKIDLGYTGIAPPIFA